MATSSAVTSVAGYVDQNDRYGWMLLDLLEHVPALNWPQSIDTYSKMRRDPQLTGVLAGYTLPLRRATWQVDPAGCRPNVVRHVADDLGLTVKGEDDPGAYRRRGVTWAEHIRMSMLHLVFGHMPFAHRFEYRDSDRLLHLVELSERMPHTITEIDVDGSTGHLNFIRQQASSKTGLQPPQIKADDMTWHVHDREGSAWQGVSLLRPAYGPWVLKQEMWRVHATSNRRNGMGLPVARALPGTNPTTQQMDAAQKVASSARAGESAGATMPPGFVLDLQGVSGSLPDTLAFVRYLDQQMSRMALSGVLDLGDTPNGSRALGESFVDLFMLSLQAVADSMADTETRGSAQRIVDVNYGEDEAVPQVVCTSIGDDQEVTVEAIKMLLDSGALSADDQLEGYLRSKFHLPERDLDATEPPRLTVVPVAAGRHARRVRAASSPGLRRDRSPVEVAAATDFAVVQDQWESALDKLVSDWGDITQAQVDQLTAQVRAAVQAGDTRGLAGLQVDTGDAADLLEAAMMTLADRAAVEQRREAAAQDVDIAAGEPDSDRLASYAVTIAALMGAGLASSAARKALQVWTPETTATAVADAVAEHLGSLTDAALRDNLGAGLSTAQNEGRLATLKAAPVPPEVLAASEILDQNSCSNCVENDGHEYATVAEGEAAYANGGFVDCLGSLRCRGVLVSVWDSASIDQAA